MTMQDSRVASLQRPILVRQSTQLSAPQMDERYFDKLAAFGLACLAAAIVGKLVMTALTQKQPSRRDS
jgi:hypothetical protein